jgi:hypothetical protein
MARPPREPGLLTLEPQRPVDRPPAERRNLFVPYVAPAEDTRRVTIDRRRRPRLPDRLLTGLLVDRKL